MVEPGTRGSGVECWFCPTHGLTCSQSRGSDGIRRCAPGGHNLIGYVPAEQLQGAVDALADLIADVAAPTGRLRLGGHDDADLIAEMLTQARSTLDHLRGR